MNIVTNIVTYAVQHYTPYTEPRQKLRLISSLCNSVQAEGLIISTGCLALYASPQIMSRLFSTVD